MSEFTIRHYLISVLLEAALGSSRDTEPSFHFFSFFRQHGLIQFLDEFDHLGGVVFLRDLLGDLLPSTLRSLVRFSRHRGLLFRLREAGFDTDDSHIPLDRGCAIMRHFQKLPTTRHRTFPRTFSAKYVVTAPQKRADEDSCLLSSLLTARFCAKHSVSLLFSMSLAVSAE